MLQPAVTKATNSDRCNRAVAQVKEKIPERRTASTEPISKKGIAKIIGNRKGDCA